MTPGLPAATTDTSRLTPLELAVVVPTFKERDNVLVLLEKLSAVLRDISYEVIFVDDDSPDGTSGVVRKIALVNPRVRIITRIRRRGLSSACLEGMMATAAPYIAVMDADLQHDETILPAMLATLKNKRLDLVVGTRNAEGGSMGEFGKSRVRLSNLGRRLSRLVAGHELSDAMSGFFIVSRSFFDEVARSVSGIGFKILLDLVASSARPVRLSEVPYTFGRRLHGESKLDIMVGMEYLLLLLDKLIGEWVPPRFAVFAMVGSVGVLLCAVMLHVLVRLLGMSFFGAQITATWITMTANFFLNNTFTYRDQMLRGRGVWIGLLSFYAACSVGALINVRLSEAGRLAGLPWQIAGVLGLAVGAVWNYGITSITTWRRGRRLTEIAGSHPEEE